MKIFNPLMTTIALVTLIMASVSTVYAGTPTPEEVENNNQLCKPSCAPVCMQPVAPIQYVMAGPIRGFVNLSAEEEKKYLQNPSIHAQNQREKEHNSQSFGYDVCNYGLALKACQDRKGDLAIKAAFEHVFHGKSELFNILNSQAHHFPAIEGIPGNVSLKEELEAAVDQCKRLKAFSRPGESL